MKLRILLPSLLCTFAVYLSADEPKPVPAKLERIVPAQMRLTVVPTASDPRPSRRRTMEIRIDNNGPQAETVNVTTSWFTEGDMLRDSVRRKYTLLSREHGLYKVDSDHDGPHTEKLTGWVVVVRRANGELLAVKGSPQRFETVARTPGAIPEK
jgi:hypothetical protein